MVCGTTSDAGKSTVVTGLCRLLARQGVKVAPFKGQNMSLNSMVTPEGGEIGRAQWLQAVAARAVPEVAMNPVLLKPTAEDASQIVVMGRPAGVESAARYHGAKARLTGVVDDALASLRERFDVVLCEGAGSPAEINLLEHDLVNLGLARRAGLSAVVVGDIERGGVFASLYGTVALLPPELAALVKGFVINRFRGDPSLLGSGPADLEARCGVPTLGVLPHLGPLGLDAEDSLALERTTVRPPPNPGLDVAAIRLPRLSNFTDLDPLAAEPGVHVRWVEHAGALGRPDLVVLGGTRATVADLRWLRDSGLAVALDALRRDPSPPVILGICGGLQMMGSHIDDPDGVESPERTTPGMGWLRLHTVFEADKVTRLVATTVTDGVSVSGYEIRHGSVLPEFGRRRWFEGLERDTALSAQDTAGNVVGTTLHGLFEDDGFRTWFLADLASRRGREWQPSGLSFGAARERQIDTVADACEEHLDLTRLWQLVESAASLVS